MCGVEHCVMCDVMLLAGWGSAAVLVVHVV